MSTASRTIVANCIYCGAQQHSGIWNCPNVKAVQFYPNGYVRRVEMRGDPRLE